MRNKTLFHSMDEFMRTYFPQEYERQLRENETPEECGRRMAQESMERAFGKGGKERNQ